MNIPEFVTKWIRIRHARLDRAVRTAYSWPAGELPAEVKDEVILERLLALNIERHRGAFPQEA